MASATNTLNRIDFNKSELFISLRSPFARRVRLALLENQISYKEIVCDVFKPTAELIAVNPLIRVPVLRLHSGDVLIDSNLILQALYETLSDSPLIPGVKSGATPGATSGATSGVVSGATTSREVPGATTANVALRLIQFRWQAIVTGFMEKIVEYFLETQRPPAGQDPEIEQDLKNMADRVLTELEAALIANPNHSFIIGDSLTQADLDLASVLTYFSLRYSHEWKKNYPRTALYLAKLEQRPSLVKTFPPGVS